MPHSPRPHDDQRRFSDEELARILELAAEMPGEALADGERHGDAGYSLRDIQQIAAEAGIPPRNVAAAAAQLAAVRRAPVPPARTGIFRFERRTPGELSRHDQVELLEAIRQETGIPGDLSEEMGAMVWSGTDGIRSARLTIRPRPGETKISVEVNGSDIRVLTWIGSILVTLFLGLFAALGLRSIGIEKAPALLGGLAVWATTAPIGARLVWNRLSASLRSRAQQLADRIGTIANEGALRHEPRGPELPPPTDAA